MSTETEQINAPTPTEDDNSKVSSRGNKSNLRALLLIGAPLFALITATFIYLHGGRYISTENAYIKADKVPISADISGPVLKVFTAENQSVSKGTELFQIDPAPFTLNVEKANAHLEQIQTDLIVLQASYQAKQSEINLARTKYEYALKKQKREANLAQQHLIADSDFDDVQKLTEIAALEITTLQHELKRIARSLGGNPDASVEQHPSYLQARAELQQAQLDLQHTTVLAPFNGTVSQLPKVGQYIRAGTAASALVANDHFWVEANLTETELTHVRPSQPVKIHIDMFPKEDWQGSVETVSPATGAEFAIIPAQNATGNWVKIAQRIPVRILLKNTEDLPQLRAGLSAEIEIDTGVQRQLLGMTL